MRNGFLSPSTTSSPSQSSHGSSSTPHQIFSASVMNAKFDFAKAIIQNWEETEIAANKPLSLFDGNRSQANEFLRSVMDLQSSMRFFILEDPTSEKLTTAQNMMKTAMNRLQKEFHRILSNNQSYLDPESVSNRSSLVSAGSSVSEICDDSEDENQATGDSVSELEAESGCVMWDLKTIADTMILSGYRKECVQIYKTIRKSIMDESLYHLGVEKMSSTQVQKMDWEMVEVKIKSWLRAVKIAVVTLFHRERVLCEQVFAASPLVAESCFAEIAKEGAMSLFGFPELVAGYKRLSVEKMFRVLDLYDAVSKLWPEIESIFSYDSISAVRSQAVNCLIRLGDAARNLLADFEAAIQKDNSTSPVSNGAIHPLTRYVVNYLIFLSDYSGILMDILKDFPKSAQSPMPESYFLSPIPEDHPGSVISERFAWLVLVLLCKLNVKASLYNDVPLSYLFLANNLNYIVSKVRTSILKLLMGDNWVLNHERKVDQYTSNYERVGWSCVISSLPKPIADISPDVVQMSFQNFNAAFDEAYRKQSTWVVPDQKLRDKIKISVAKKLVPVYQEFYEMHRMMFRGECGAKSIVRHAPDDLGNYLSDLFYGTGKATSIGSSSSSRSSR